MFYLAARLGCTVSELHGRMSRREFNEWMVFLKFEKDPSTLDPEKKQRELDAKMMSSFKVIDLNQRNKHGGKR